MEKFLEKHELKITLVSLFLGVLAGVAFGITGHLWLPVSMALFFGPCFYLLLTGKNFTSKS